MLYGVSMTSAVSAGVIMASIPAVVALLSRFMLGERIHPRTAWAIACAALGMVLLGTTQAGSTTPGGDTGKAWLGNLLVFAAVLCEAAYAVIGKRLTATLGPRRITAVINLWGLLLATPLGLAAAWDFDFAAVAPSLWVLLLFYALAASVWTVWLWMTGLRTIPASQGGVFTVMLPVSAAVIGVLVLGEPLHLSQAVAFLLALSGVVLATRPQVARRRGEG